MFPALPDLTRLRRLVRRGSASTDEFLTAPSFVPVADTYGIAWRHPRRAGRCPQYVGKKGISNGRGIIGVTVGWLIKNAGKMVVEPWDTANVSDREYRDLALASNHETIVVCDYGFRKRDASREHMRFCAKGTWNERSMIKTDVR